MRDDECIRFLQEVLPRLGMRWAGFRKPRRQVCKRVGRRMATLGLGSVSEYRVYLEAHPDEWRVLDRACRVTISRFQRDRGVWLRLERVVLPELALGVAASGGSRLRAWSAGCASGEEPFSLAILWELVLAARFPSVRLRVVATDSDLRVLARARRGAYPEGAMKELPPDWRARAFVAAGGAELALRERFRRPVRLVCADLREGSPKGPFELVLCRNLAFTYFDEVLQGRIAERFAGCVRPGGCLVLGSHETLPRSAEAWQHVADGIYRRAAVR